MVAEFQERVECLAGRGMGLERLSRSVFIAGAPSKLRLGGFVSELQITLCLLSLSSFFSRAADHSR